MTFEAFESLGGVFPQGTQNFVERQKNISTFIFDWDGVFNDGVKFGDQGSPFSEADSMGLNMMRFSHWLIHGHVPRVFIVSGANNPTAIQFAQREHLHGVLIKAKNKFKAFENIGHKFDFELKEVAFFFDDILDLGAAEHCGLRIAINRQSSPLFKQFILDQDLADYITGTEGGEHAVREASELYIHCNGNFDQTVTKRMAFEGDYAQYLDERNAVVTELIRE